MENQQAVSFLASLVDVMVRAVKEEVLQSLDKDALITKAIHSAVDYDETFWQRITNHVDKSQEKIESNVKDWLATELPHQLEHFKGSGSSGEPASTEWLGRSTVEFRVRRTGRQRPSLGVNTRSSSARMGRLAQATG